jgi:glycine/D-amino acid oxidase-like deaminating enzyme
VALCEKGVIAGEASGRSLGWIDSLFLDPIKFELIARSKALWAEMTARVRSDIGYQPAGLMGLFKDAQELADGEAWLASVKDRPTSDGRLLSTADISKIAPKSSIPWVGAVFQPSDALAEARLAAPAIAEAAQRHGASILQHCAVRGIETSAAYSTRW